MRYIGLLAVMALTGCASQPDNFDRPDATADQISRDYAACQLYAMNVPDRDTDTAATLRPAGPVGALLIGLHNAERPREIARLCMQTKGYVAWK